MSKLFSLIGATFSQDMNVFQFKGKKMKSPMGTIIFGIFFMFIFGFYAEGRNRKVRKRFARKKSKHIDRIFFFGGFSCLNVNY